MGHKPLVYQPARYDKSFAPVAARVNTQVAKPIVQGIRPDPDDFSQFALRVRFGVFNDATYCHYETPGERLCSPWVRPVVSLRLFVFTQGEHSGLFLLLRHAAARGAELFPRI
jgi:hypothetical protein